MGILERREREKRLRREMILEASKKVFFERGLRAATLEDIAERAELSKGTIYLYFSSKEDLYASLMTRALELLLEMFKSSRPEELRPAAAIRRLAEAYLLFSRNESYLFKILGVVESPLVGANLSPKIFSELEGASDDILSYVATFVDKGKKEGSFRADVSSHEAVLLFWLSLSGVLNLKARSADLREGSILSADSVVGSVDFDRLFGNCLDYLIGFLSAGMRRVDGRRRAKSVSHSKPA